MDNQVQEEKSKKLDKETRKKSREAILKLIGESDIKETSAQVKPEEQKTIAQQPKQAQPLAKPAKPYATPTPMPADTSRAAMPPEQPRRKPAAVLTLKKGKTPKITKPATLPSSTPSLMPQASITNMDKGSPKGKRTLKLLEKEKKLVEEFLDKIELPKLEKKKPESGISIDLSKNIEVQKITPIKPVPARQKVSAEKEVMPAAILEEAKKAAEEQLDRVEQETAAAKGIVSRAMRAEKNKLGGKRAKPSKFAIDRETLQQDEGKKKEADEKQKIKFSFTACLKTTIGFLFLMIFEFFAVYLLFSFFILSTRFDHEITRKINAYLPVPAVASKNMLVDYYQYSDWVKEIRNVAPNLSNEEIKQIILKRVTDSDTEAEKIWILVK